MKGRLRAAHLAALGAGQGLPALGGAGNRGRLSRASGRIAPEFRREIVCLAQLPHRKGLLRRGYQYHRFL